VNLPPLAPVEEMLLLAIYYHQFDREEDLSTDGLDWQDWAERAGIPEAQASWAAHRLGERRLIEDEDATGQRVRVRLMGVMGVMKAEKSPQADPDFIERQKALRRRILKRLIEVQESVTCGRTSGFFATSGSSLERREAS